MLTAGSERFSDFIARLPPRDREDLLRLATDRGAAKGELIFQAGSAGHHVYFLETGRVKIYHLSPTGKEILLWFCLPGEIFGLAEVWDAVEALDNAGVTGLNLYSLLVATIGAILGLWLMRLVRTA